METPEEKLINEINQFLMEQKEKRSLPASLFKEPLRYQKETKEGKRLIAIDEFPSLVRALALENLLWVRLDEFLRKRPIGILVHLGEENAAPEIADVFLYSLELFYPISQTITSMLRVVELTSLPRELKPFILTPLDLTLQTVIQAELRKARHAFKLSEAFSFSKQYYKYAVKAYEELLKYCREPLHKLTRFDTMQELYDIIERFYILSAYIEGKEKLGEEDLKLAQLVFDALKLEWGLLYTPEGCPLPEAVYLPLPTYEVEWD